MEKSVQEVLEFKGGNYILPFLWMRGEEEQVIRREIQKIDECGIKAVCLEARPHPDYAAEGWWHDVDIVLDEAKKRGMRIWILDDAHFPTGMANGLLEQKYPKRAKQYVKTECLDVTGPLLYANLDVMEIMKKQMTWMDLGRKIIPPLMDEKQLLSVTASRLIENDIISAEMTDLTAYVRDGVLTYSFPEGVWRVFVTFTTYDGEGMRNYINIIDRDSVHVLVEAVYETHYERYRDEFGNTFAGFFSDEPGFGNTAGFAMDEMIGRKLMPLPWNREVPVMLEERLGGEWKTLLPYLWYAAEGKTTSARIRFIYMDIVTRLYEKNFSCQLGDWCAAHGVEYIGHVIEDNNQHSRLGCGAGHYFRAMSGQHMAGIDNIGGQVLFGNPDSTRHGWSVADGRFFHYAIGKMGASSALFDPKKKGRLMCETYGAYGWGCGVKHMKWITDQLLSRGVNYLVPHAFSMADYPDSDCPPHFYVGGNNPQFPYFAELMKYANRMCHVLSGGKSVPEAGILYHGELEWLGDCMKMQEPARVLFQNQIEFSIVPIDALTEREHYQTEVKDGELWINGVRIPVLIIPESEYIDSRLAGFLVRNPGVKALFLNSLPDLVKGTAPALADQGGKEQTACSDEAWEKEVQSYETVSLKELPGKLLGEGAVRIETDNPFPSLTSYHYRKEQDIYMLFNESGHEIFDGEVSLPEGKGVRQYDGLENKVKPVDFRIESGRTLCSLRLEPYELVLLFVDDRALPCGRSVSTGIETEGHENAVIDISENWKVSLAKAKEYPQFCEVIQMGELEPVSVRYPRFSGIMKYEKQINLEYAEGRFRLHAEHIYETARLCVNGKYAGIRLCPPYEFDLTGLLKEGKNLLEIEIANTPARDVLNYESLFGPERSILEPGGMFGKVEIWRD